MPKREHLYQTVIAVLLLVVAGADGRSPESDLAAPGAPLYEYAVTESVKTLMSKQEQAELGAAGRPPSPGPDYDWCENCKTYHKKGQTPATPRQPAADPATRPPSPGAGHYWCEHCKTYHKKGQTPATPGQPATDPATRPPSPGPDHYWCEHCKTYHKKKTPASAQQPAAAQRPGASPTAPLPLSADYYYCEKCKTYHRRKPVAQQPVMDASRIVGGVSNSPNRSPLIGPAKAKR